MSGCHPFVPRCKHGMAINLECAMCEPRIESWQSEKEIKERLDKIETYIETGMLHNDWRHKILKMERDIHSISIAQCEMKAFYDTWIVKLEDQINNLKRHVMSRS